MKEVSPDPCGPVGRPSTMVRARWPPGGVPLPALPLHSVTSPGQAVTRIASVCPEASAGPSGGGVPGVSDPLDVCCDGTWPRRPQKPRVAGSGVPPAGYGPRRGTLAFTVVGTWAPGKGGLSRGGRQPQWGGRLGPQTLSLSLRGLTSPSQPSPSWDCWHWPSTWSPSTS